jgi:FAD:protein FMN transferase
MAASHHPSGRTSREDGYGPDPAKVVGLGAPGAIPGLHRFSHEAMATVFEVFTTHPVRQYAAQAAQAAFELVDQLEGQLSRFIANSDITRINRLRAGEGTRVGPAALECLAVARQVFDLTGGAFDCSLGTGLAALDLHDDGWVLATIDGIRLDLGAIGKGYAVDRMADVIEEWDLGPALVHGGFSSMLALEPPSGLTGWPLTMSDPTNPSCVLNRVAVRQTALGASGLQKGDHIRDPRTGRPVRGRQATWATLPRALPSHPTDDPDAGPRMAATAADALTTAFMLLDLEEISAICDANPGVEAWVLPSDETAESALLHFGRSGA